MYGWLLTNLDSLIQFNNAEVEKIIYKNFTVIRKHNSRFVNDSIFQETNKYIIVLDGIIFNRQELIVSYKRLDWLNLVIYLYEKYDRNFPDFLRGYFSGVFIDKQEDSIFSFTNHIGDSGIFYSNLGLQDNSFCLGNNLNWMVDVFKENNFSYTLDLNAVKFMSTFGYMLDQTTYISEISRMMPGEYLKIKDSKLINGFYHVFDNTETIDMCETELIEEIDRLFRQAIDREFGKDKEYGYKSIVDLSGGLDCRVVNYVAKDMGYNDVLNISFSQSGSDESKAMLAVFRDLGNPLIYIPLDNANHLFEIDKIIANNYGLSYFAGAGAIMTVLENIDLEQYGLEHGGILGDIAEGVFLGKSYTEHTRPTFEAGMPFSRLLGFDFLDKEILDKYPNAEMFAIMGRGLLGGANTQLLRRNYTGYTSPFEDVDFYDFVLSIPLEIRGKGEILHKWILVKYPEAFEIISDHLMCKPSASSFTKKRKTIQKKIKGRINRILSRFFPALSSNNMNPLEFWFKTNIKLQKFVMNYYDENIERLGVLPEAKTLVSTLYNDGNITNKLQALTVLGAVKKYF